MIATALSQAVVRLTAEFTFTEACNVADALDRYAMYKPEVDGKMLRELALTIRQAAKPPHGF